MSLDDLRHKLDKIDRNIATNIALRMATVAHIAKAKRDESGQRGEGGALSVLRPLRERELLRVLFDDWKGKGGLCLPYRVWRLLMGCSYKEQGIEGVFELEHRGEEKHKNPHLIGEMQALVQAHFGDALPFTQRDMKGNTAQNSWEKSPTAVGVWNVRGEWKNCWWSAVWQDDKRWWVRGAFPQVRLRLDDTYARKRWTWWSDEQKPPCLLIVPYGGKGWSKQPYDMDVCLFGAKSLSFENFIVLEQTFADIAKVEKWGESAQKQEGSLWYHRLYGLERKDMKNITPHALEQEMQAKFGQDDKIEWRLLGGYILPLELDARTFFDGEQQA